MTREYELASFYLLVLSSNIDKYVIDNQVDYPMMKTMLYSEFNNNQLVEFIADNFEKWFSNINKEASSLNKDDILSSTELLRMMMGT